MDEEVQEFKLGPAFFAHFRRVTLSRGLPLMLLAGAAGIGISHQRSHASWTGVELVLNLSVMVLLFFIVRRVYRQQVERLRGFRLQISTGGLRHTQPGLAEVFIPADQIRRLVEQPDGALRIHGATAAQVIAIPATIEAFEQIRQTVQAWCPSETASARYPTTGLSLLASLGAIAAMVAVFLGTNAVLVTVLGATLIAGLVWAFFALRKNPLVEEKARRSVWYVWVLIYAVAAKVWSMWAG